MNILEFFLLVLSLLILCFLLWHEKRPLKKVFWLIVLVVIPLYFSIRETTQFLTIDERWIVLQPTHIDDISFSQWKQGFLHTTLAFQGLLFGILEALISLPDVWLKAYAKAFHWLIGFGVFSGIYCYLRKFFASKDSSFVVLFVFFIFLLPTNLMALRVFNYDLLSMSLGVLSFLMMASALIHTDLKEARNAVIVATLAAQEKLSASPFLIMSLVVFAFLFTVKKKNGSSFPHPLGLLKAFGLSLLTLFLTHLIWFASVEIPPQSSFSQFFFPFVGWLIPFVTRVQEGGVQSYPLVWLAVPVGGVAVGVVFLNLVRNRVDFRSLEKRIRMVNGFLVVWGIVVGLFGTFFVRGYLEKPGALDPLYYHPMHSWNQVILHFASFSFTGHILKFIAWAYASYVNAIPTLLWLGLFFFLRRRYSELISQKFYLTLQAALLLSIVTPLFFGLSQTPVGNKYLNIPLLLFALVSLVGLAAQCWLLDLKKRRILIFLMLIALLAEVLPFGPLYASFRPFWSNYREDYSVHPIRGEINPSWIGWGEEAMIAGKKIARLCDQKEINCTDVRIYCAYAGDWLFPPSSIQVFCSGMGNQPEFRFSDQDFYVINRSYVVQGGFFPAKAEPFLTIDFRGFVQAWVFRGDELERKYRSQ